MKKKNENKTKAFSLTKNDFLICFKKFFFSTEKKTRQDVQNEKKTIFPKSQKLVTVSFVNNKKKGSQIQLIKLGKPSGFYFLKVKSSKNKQKKFTFGAKQFLQKTCSERKNSSQKKNFFFFFFDMKHTRVVHGFGLGNFVEGKKILQKQKFQNKNK
jgi:hypothetical protein